MLNYGCYFLLYFLHYKVHVKPFNFPKIDGVQVLMKLHIHQWIVDAWAKVSASNVVQAFIKTGFITEKPSNSNETDSENDERDPGMHDVKITQLLNSDTDRTEELTWFVEDYCALSSAPHKMQYASFCPAL